MPTVRTGESVTLSYATQPTTRTVLAGVGWIDIIEELAGPLCGVVYALGHQSALPLAQSSARAFSYSQFLGGLWQRQPLEYQHRVGGCPGNQLGGGLLAKGSCAVALPATKPFQQAAHGARVLLLCLVDRKCFLETTAGFARADVPHLEILATDKESVAIGIDGNKGVRFVQVDPNRMDTLRIGDAERDDHATEQSPITLDDRHAVDFDGFAQCLCEGIRHAVGDALAPCHRPDR